MNFRSDNEAPVAPAIFEAIARANRGTAWSYGADPASAGLDGLFSDLFEAEVKVFAVATGTAANALSLAALAPPHGAILCHQGAHIQVDECGAAEFYTAGAKLLPLVGDHGKITAPILAAAIAEFGALAGRLPPLAALSLTQATEAGTVYSGAEIKALADIAHDAGLGVHMDGARFANALVHLGCPPAEITWRAGVDVLSFGATKNGAMAAEAVVAFRPDLAAALALKRKRAGHLLSKTRFAGAQFEAYLGGGLWLDLAARANRGATRLGDGLARIEGVTVIHPVEANEVFLSLPAAAIEALVAGGVEFHRWPGPGAGNVIRLVVPWNVADADIASLLALVRAAPVSAVDHRLSVKKP